MITSLVTGGAGFIGSHLVEALVSAGHRVSILDNLATGKLANLSAVMDRINLITGDIRDPETVRRAATGVEFIFHQAALSSVPLSVADPLATHEINTNGTLNLLQAARDAGVRRIVYSASSSAYGDTPILPQVEDMGLLPPSPYAASKLAGEAYMSAFAKTYGLETISLRYFNVFGPRQDEESQYAAAIPRFINAFLSGRPVTIFGDGRQTRDFTYVENVVQANLLAMQAPKTNGEAVNIACGRSISLNDLIAVISGIFGREVPVQHVAPREGDIRDSMADITLARRLLGYDPLVALDEGLRKTIRWYQDHGTA